MGNGRMQGGDILEALALLSRLPLPAGAAAQRRGAAAGWAWPLAGALLGALGALGAQIALWLGLGAGPAAAFALAVLVMAGGALHEDGLADCADGFWGAHDRARRLEIMRDSRVGSYGVLALVLSVLLRWSLLAGLIGAGHLWGVLIASAALSRVPMVALMHLLPAARPGGLSHGTGRPSGEVAILAAVVGLLVALIFQGLAALWAALPGAALAAALAALARARIGGQSGDVLGAAQQLAEIGLLAGFAMLV